MVSGCRVLVQTLYLARQMLRGYQLADAINIPPWYSPVQSKPVSVDDMVTAYWDVPVFTKHF